MNADGPGRPYFGCHPAFRPGSEPDEHVLTRSQLGYAEASKGFHVDENVLASLALSEETKALDPVEPLDRRRFEPAFGDDLDMCT